MKVDWTRTGEWSVVSVEGRMDTVSAPEFEQKMKELIAGGQKRLCLDLSRLEYVSSAGLRALLVAAKRAQAEGGRLACCNLQGVCRKVFEISGFGSVLPVFDSVEAALDQP